MDNQNEPFRLRYEGRRFDDHRMPLDVLADLPAFRDLIVAFAKSTWRQTHAGRVRLPKGFDKSLSFDLACIEPGSAVPVMLWDSATAQSELPGVAAELSNILGSSYQAVVKLFDDAANDEYPRALSSEYIRCLNKFGAALRDGERILFPGSRARGGGSVYLDSRLRRDLITRVRETYETRFEGTGTLVGIDAPPAADFAELRVFTRSYGLIGLPVPRDRIKVEFDGYIDSPVQFDLLVELDNQDAFRSVIAVNDILVIEASPEATRLISRLQEIAALEAGWMDGSADSINGEAVEAAQRFINLFPELVPASRVFPMESGGVLLEFEFLGWDYSVEFQNSGSIEIYGIEIIGAGVVEPQSFSRFSSGLLVAVNNILLGVQ